MGPAAHYRAGLCMDRAEKPPSENALKSELKVDVGKYGQIGLLFHSNLN